jgi:hypothetical protein
LNSRISLSNWGFHKKSTKHGNEGAHRKSVEGYTLIYYHDLITPREALIKPLEPLLKELQESPPPTKEARKVFFGGNNLWDKCWGSNHGMNKFQGSQNTMSLV